MQRSAGGIILNKGKIILVKEKEGFFGFPKGHIRFFEKPIEAAIREIYEESNITDLEKLYDFKPYIRRTFSGKLKKIHLFLFKTKQIETHPNDPENLASNWIDLDKVIDELYYDKDKLFLEKNIAKIKEFL